MNFWLIVAIVDGCILSSIGIYFLIKDIHGGDDGE